ncbi:hypothetical protein [Campylobacter fetus]|uniref:hypothetical protein n=1 Tax=Campylobacter fetus TaxID=196 RepID=UPI000818AD15|nr:hypothetical protein [Campylobacter fetus]OCR84916.1 hypothetical protein CFT12S05168_07375 [Campylobacter fetus subsp. testudinum]
MKNIFIFIMFILFGNVGLFGVDVHCNKSGEIIEDGKIIKEGKSYLKEGNTYILGDFKNDKNADGTSKEEIVEIPDGNTHTYELYATNIDANFIINDWDQTSIRIKAKVKSKIAVKITEVVHLPGTWLTVDNSFVHYRFLDPAYAGETLVMDKGKLQRNYGGICYQKRLDQFDPSAGNLYSGTKDKDEFFTVADEGETVNVLFEIDQTLVKSTLITVSTSIFRFKATITVTPIAPSSVDSSTKLMIVNDQYNVKAPGAVDASGDFTGDTNLYTQIVGKPFDARVISVVDRADISDFYYGGLFSELDNGKIVSVECVNLQPASHIPLDCPPLSPDKPTTVILFYKFQQALDGLMGASPKNPKSYNLKDFTIPANRTDINYNKLFFVFSGYYKPKNSIMSIISNYFSARPAKIVLEARDLKNELFGGKEYNSFDPTITNEIYTKLTALDDSGNNAAASYNAKFISKSMISLDKSAGGSEDPKKWCSYDGSEDDDKRLLNVSMVTTAKFDKGIGKVYTNYDATNNKYYIKYPDIGHTKIYILDDDTTMIDQVNGDCIKGSTSNDKVNGKIGCNVALEADYFKFKPSSFQITRKELKNGYISDDGNITFFSFGKDYGMLVDGDNPNYTDFMGGKLELDIQARLADNTVPNLYSKNCYVNDVNINFELDKTADEKKALEDAKNNVSFYGIKDRTLGLDQNETYLIKIENLDTNGVLKNDGKFKLAKNSFYAGESNVSLKINFDREYNVAKDPIRIKSSDFKINGQDTIYTSVVINDKVIAVDDDRVVDYFYGRVYSDRLEENMEEIEGDSCDVDIYYGVYCGDECQTKQGANEKYEFIKDTINTTDDKKDLDYARISDLNYYKVKHFNKLRSDEFAELLWKSQVDGLNLKIYNRNSPKVEDSFGSIEASEWKMGLYYNDDLENIFTISIKTPNYMKYDKNYIGGDPKDSSFKVKFIRGSSSWVGSGKQGDVMGIYEDDKLIKSKKGRIDW